MTQEQIATLITTIVLPVLTALAAFAIAYLRKKTAELTASIKDKTAQKYVDMACSAALQAVQYTTQTYVDALKAKGEFDKQAQLEALNKAKDVAVSMITEDAKNIITEAYGDFDVWIYTKIEQLVRETKEITTGADE